MLSFRIKRTYSLHHFGAERAIQQLPEQMAKIQEALATGKRINRASDDPTDYLRGRKIETIQRRIETYQRNIDHARNWLQHAESALNKMTDLLSSMYELGVQAASETTSTEDRQLIADRMEALRAEMLDFANGKFEGKYLFAGTATQTKPFQEVSGSILYQGNTETPVRQINDSQQIPVSITGEDLQNVGGATLFERIDNLINAVRTSDVPTISARNDALIEGRDHLLKLTTALGASSERLTITEEHLNTLNIALSEQQSELEDVDMAEALTQFQNTQLAYQSALKTTASILKTSLLDYL